MKTASEDIKRILDNDEEIIKSYKPNKKRFVYVNLFLTGLFFIIPIGVFIFGFLGLIDVVKIVNEAGQKDISVPIGLMAFGSFGLVLFLISEISLFIRYKKTFYYVSNKRLIIRSGFIGADYKSLPLDTVGVMDVRVDFLDKFVKNNTGTIIFGSASAPVVVNQQNNVVFAFRHLDNPYETYKEITELVSSEENKKDS